VPTDLSVSGSRGLTPDLRLAVRQSWQWLRSRSRQSDFADLLKQAFSQAQPDPSWQRKATVIQRSLGNGLGLPNLRFELADAATMQGLLGAYAGKHPSGRPTILVNAEWFAKASDDQRLKLLLQEIGHAIDDRLNGPGIDSRGDEGALFAELLTAPSSQIIDARAFNYNDHYNIKIGDLSVAVEASTANSAPTATYNTSHSVLEGAPLLTGPLTASDPDSAATVTYSLLGSPIPGFTITDGTGKSASIEVPATARLPLRSTLTGGELFLGGDFIELGISSVGSFGTTGSRPIGFYGTAGSGSIGLSNDIDGFGIGQDLRIDFFLPGSPEERWSIGWNGNASGSFSALNGQSGALTNTS